MFTALFAATLIAQPAAPTAAASAEQQIRAQRAAFNGALARGDLGAIAAVLAGYAQIMTGLSSLVFSGRAAQIGMWWEDFHSADRASYVRTPERIDVSLAGPMAMETGRWRGVRVKSGAANWASGSYSAKWRRIDDRWLVESEIYMTTACGGSFCPKPE